MFWSYLLVGIGQLLVCLVFCEVVSQYPIAGGIFPWAQRLVNVHWAWMAGWIYMWALWTTIAAVAVGSGPYLLSLLGASSASQEAVTVVALGLILVSTVLNLSGTRILARVAIAGFLAELIGALVVGSYLLVFERIQPIGVLFDTFQIQSGGSYLPAFLAASLAGLFLYYGFEACGDVAEEVPNPSQQIPKAMRMTIYIGGAAAMFTCLAFILALPNIPKVISGEDTDPIQTVLMQAFGPAGSRAVILVVGISFLSCALSLQAAASRLLFSFARDRMIVGHKVRSRISGEIEGSDFGIDRLWCDASHHCNRRIFQDRCTNRHRQLRSDWDYIAFQMIVLGALIARRRGWKPSGSFTLGNRGKAVTVAALCYGVLAIVNIGWPRAPETPWFINYSVALSTAVVISAGLAYLLIAKPVVR